MVKFPHEKFLRMSNYHAFLYEDLLCFSQQFPQKAKLSQWIYTKKNLFMTWTLVSTDAYSRSRWRVHCVSFLSALFTVFLLICVVHLVLGCFPLYRTNRLETTQTILLRKNGTRRNQSYRWIAACVTDKTEPQDLRMRHHWPVHRCQSGWREICWGSEQESWCCFADFTNWGYRLHLRRHAGYHQSVWLNCIPEVQILF